jgi:riboflavin biosynthesis pyrimidine reductase
LDCELLGKKDESSNGSVGVDTVRHGARTKDLRHIRSTLAQRRRRSGRRCPKQSDQIRRVAHAPSFDWANLVLIAGNIADDVAELRTREGLELQVHGSANLIQTLMAHDLIDEYRLWVFPVVIGKGKRLSADGAVPR